MKKRVYTVLFLFIILVLSLFSEVLNQPESRPADGFMRVSFIDVGQGDSAFIEFPDGQTALIDAGEASASDNIIDLIEGYGYDTIDYVVCTHPHSDHIGGMSEVIEQFQIKEVYMPRVSHTSKTFERLLTTIGEKGLKIHTAKAGVLLDIAPEIVMEFVAPCGNNYEEMNDYSAVVRLRYGEKAFLFTGDAEEFSEKEILDAGYDVKADVLKVGHHGSVSSSSYDFLQAVAPKWAVISSGEDNDYGHPHRETLATLKKMNITVLRTDRMGTITFITDGTKIQEET